MLLLASVCVGVALCGSLCAREGDGQDRGKRSAKPGKTKQNELLAGQRKTGNPSSNQLRIPIFYFRQPIIHLINTRTGSEWRGSNKRRGQSPEITALTTPHPLPPSPGPKKNTDKKAPLEAIHNISLYRVQMGAPGHPPHIKDPTTALTSAQERGYWAGFATRKLPTQTPHTARVR